MDLKKEIGQRIAICRTKLGISQAELGKRANISARIISRTESGRNSLKSENLAKVAQVLGVSTEYLMTGLTEVDDIAEIREMFLKLSPKQIASAKTIIKAYVDAVSE